METKKTKRIKLRQAAPAAMSLEEFLDKTLGKKGTKKRAANDLKAEKLREERKEKLYTENDMIFMYDEAQALALKNKKYTAISGYKKIISKLKK